MENGEFATVSKDGVIAEIFFGGGQPLAAQWNLPDGSRVAVRNKVAIVTGHTRKACREAVLAKINELVEQGLDRSQLSVDVSEIQLSPFNPERLPRDSSESRDGWSTSGSY